MSPVSPRALQTGLLLLLLCMAAQAAFTYSDPSGRSLPPLSPAAERGRRIFQQHNCQSCHQLFGFGGFLGPDLTNRAALLNPEALQAILQAGPGPMPSFSLSIEEASELFAFFREIDRMGVSQPRSPDGRLRLGSLPWFEYPRSTP